MMGRLTIDEIRSTFCGALANGWIRDEDTSVMFHDLGFLEQRIRHLIGLFPPQTLHALAIKANPLTRLMKFTHSISPQVGVEAASIGEAELALHAGFSADRIVYDSPVKTRSELAFALKEGIRINADNLTELARIGQLISGGCSYGPVGIRVNPQVGAGAIAESSVAGEYSKFGVPVKTGRQELADAFRKYPWLTGVHLHVGSQGCKPELLLEGIGVLYELVAEIEKDTGRRIKQFDIGGGFPISYSASEPSPSIKAFAASIKSKFPSLFTYHSSLITEFGRWVYTNAGWTATRVEYVKHDPGINTAMIHTGADLFVRECLNPKDWHHEYSVIDRNGNLKTGHNGNLWNLAGPLCFSGDILAKNLPLPEIEEGDYIIIHDTGGYTLSMWSRYNSRFAPRILGYSGSEFQILKERENLQDLSSFWGGNPKFDN